MVARARKSMVFSLALAMSAATALALPKSYSVGGGTVVKDSTISATTETNVTAIGGSNVNTGVSAKNSYIRDSDISSNVTGTVDALYSNVNLGVKVDGAYIDNSKVSSTTNVGTVNAVNSNVSTGVELSGAMDSTIRTNVSAGSINAENSNVNIGTVKGFAADKKVSTNVGVGDVNAVNKSVNIGNVNLGGGGGGGGGGGRGGGSSGDGGTNIGNVNVDSSRVKEVSVTVGDGAEGSSLQEKIEARHMSKVYSENGGVDPSGTKHIYVDGKEVKEGEKSGKGAGNVTIGNSAEDRKIRKVDIFVDDE